MTATTADNTNNSARESITRGLSIDFPYFPYYALYSLLGERGSPCMPNTFGDKSLIFANLIDVTPAASCARHRDPSSRSQGSEGKK